MSQLTPRAIELLNWHHRELTGLLERCDPGSLPYEAARRRLDEIASLRSEDDDERDEARDDATGERGCQ